MRMQRLFVVVVLLAAAFMPLSAQSAGRGGSAGGKGGSGSGTTCRLPESDAEALVILNNYYPGYWWDHTDLTVAVQAHPSATDEQLAAIHDAIATWDEVLRDCFDGLITLTDVTICGDHGCPNILVRSDLPPSQDRDPYDPEYLGWVTLHELGHALGLGHATNLLESTDLMGYGWPDLGDPVLSDCDLDALAFVFAWALEGSEPYQPAAGPYDCSLD
jgi:hypothetical protein